MRPMSAKQAAPQGLTGPKVQNQRNNRRLQEEIWKRQEFQEKSKEIQHKAQTPKYVTTEEMQKELIQYKQEMNIFSLENIQLKTKIQKYRNDIEKKDKVISSILEKLNSNQEGNLKLKADPEMGKVISLKQQVMNLREKLRIKKDIHREMESYMKDTEVPDAEEKVFAAMKECKDVRLNIEKEQLNTISSYETLKNIGRLEDKLKEQNEAIADMRKNNTRLSIKIERTEKDIKEAREKGDKIETQRQKYATDHKKLTINKDKLAKANKEMEELKEQIDYLDMNGERADTYKERLEELEKQQKEMKEEISEWKKKIEKFREETDNKKAAENKKILKTEIDRMKIQIAESKFHSKQIDNEELKKINAEKKPKLKVKPVEKYSLNSNPLKYALIYFNIQPSEILHKIFKNYRPEDNITIYELARMLMRISRGEDCEKIARYLIEPPLNEDKEYDNNLEKNVQEVNDQLLNFIGEYSIPKEADIRASITKVPFIIS